MAASNQSLEAITPEFVPKATYKKLFALKKETWPYLWEIGKNVAATCHPIGRGESGNNPPLLEVICLGYGEGWRDLPVLLGLLEEGWSCNVVAIEPTWSESGNAAKEFASQFIKDLRLSYSVREDEQGQSNQFTVTHNSNNNRACTIQVFGGTAEKWLQEKKAKYQPNSTHIVLAMCVLHLLSDWKATLGWFLDVALKPGGCILAGETPGSISAFDGDFRRLRDDDPWHRASGLPQLP